MSLRRESLSVQRARQTLGRSTRLWVGDGRHDVEHDRWVALSGARSVDYNVVCWYGSDPDIDDGLSFLREAGVPAVQMLAGPALAAAQRLADAEWVCIGTTPVMALDLGLLPFRPQDPDVAQIGPSDLPEVRRVVGETFDLAPALIPLALPELVVEDPTMQVWTLRVGGEIRSCVAVVIIEDVVVLWSMATPARYQRQGLGRRLLLTMLKNLAAQGVRSCLCYASGPGQSLYREVGFEVLEHWQMWSRPRWVLGRA